MHIGFLLGDNRIGGMERQASLLARALVLRGEKVTVFLLAPPKLNPVARKETVDFDGVKTRRLWYTKKFTSIASTRYLGRLLQRLNVSVLFAYHLGAMEVASEACSLAGNMPYIGSVRGIAFADDERLAKRYRNVCSLATRITCNCQATANLLIEKKVCNETDFISVIPNGIELGLQRKREECSDSFNILFAASIKTVKDPIRFAKAACIVMNNNHEVIVTVAGIGHLEPEMRQVFSNAFLSDRVCFLGQVSPDMVPYSKADLVVSSSLREASSNTILEALANGVPVVATAVGGSVEVLAGKPFGRLVPPGEVRALADAMEEMVCQTPENLRVIKGQAANFIKKEFSMWKMVEHHLNLFEEVCA